MKPRLQVMKFGGTSVGDAVCIARTAQIIAKGTREKACVAVVSAMSGVTNRLIEVANKAQTGNVQEAVDAIEGLRAQHEAVLLNLTQNDAERCQLPGQSQFQRETISYSTPCVVHPDMYFSFGTRSYGETTMRVGALKYSRYHNTPLQQLMDVPCRAQYQLEVTGKLGIPPKKPKLSVLETVPVTSAPQFRNKDRVVPKFLLSCGVSMYRDRVTNSVKGYGVVCPRMKISLFPTGQGLWIINSLKTNQILFG
jgi:hypothetical protein